jgi:hypothetical protein
MSETDLQFDVRDTRNKNWLWMRRELLREHGSELGAHGIAVYAAIASFAGANETAYPSMKTIADLIGCSRKTVKRRIKDLHRLGWIAYEKRYRDDGSPTSHRFFLLPCPVHSSPPPDSDTQGVPSEIPHPPDSRTQEVEGKEVDKNNSAHAREDNLPPHAPTVEQVIRYGAGQAGIDEGTCREFWRHYAAVDFMDPHGRKIKNWKYKLANWKANASKFSTASGDGQRTEEPEIDSTFR